MGNKRLLSALILVFFLCSYGVVFSAEEAPQKSSVVYVIDVKGVINPVIASYVHRGISTAEDAGAVCIVIQMDTPGGLDTSMRDIIQRIIRSKIPVVVYVHPKGARAASAGVFITMAAHVAAMSPNTNIGSASPVQMGGGDKKETKENKTMMAKITNDAVAYIKSTAKRTGRNAEWAEDAVRKSISATEEEALNLKVIDVIASNLSELLYKIDGKEVVVGEEKRVLRTKEAKTVFLDMTFGEKFLHTISNPNIAYILLTLGVYGLIYEMATPGAIFPGVMGGICLILAFFALGMLPVNYAGLFLLLFSFALFIIDIKAPTHGVLTVGAVISLVIGSMMMINSDQPYFQISRALIFAVATCTALFFIFVIALVVKVLKKVPVTGREGLIGMIGWTRTPLAPKGIVFVNGERWSAYTKGEAIHKGERVKVLGIEGMTLEVEEGEKK